MEVCFPRGADGSLGFNVVRTDQSDACIVSTVTTSAAAAGLAPGDRVLAVDGVGSAHHPISYDVALGRLRGGVGDGGGPVSLLISRRPVDRK